MIEQAFQADDPEELWRSIEVELSAALPGQEHWSDLMSKRHRRKGQLARLLICAADRPSHACFQALAVAAFDPTRWAACEQARRASLESQFTSSMREWNQRAKSKSGLSARAATALRAAIAAYFSRAPIVDRDEARKRLIEKAGLLDGSIVAVAISDGARLARIAIDSADLGQSI